MDRNKRHGITLGAIGAVTVLATSFVTWGPPGDALRIMGEGIDNVLMIGDETLPEVQQYAESFANTMDTVDEQYGSFSTHVDAFEDKLDVEEAVSTRAESLTEGTQSYIQGLGDRFRDTGLGSKLDPGRIDAVTDVTKRGAESTIEFGASATISAVPEVPRAAYNRIGALVTAVTDEAHSLSTQAKEAETNYLAARQHVEGYDFSTLLPNIATGLTLAPFLIFLGGYMIGTSNEHENTDADQIS